MLVNSEGGGERKSRDAKGRAIAQSATPCDRGKVARSTTFGHEIQAVHRIQRRLTYPSLTSSSTTPIWALHNVIRPILEGDRILRSRGRKRRQASEDNSSLLLLLKLYLTASET